MAKLSNKVAIITGAGSGIGAGIAYEFARNGCALTLVGRNEINLDHVANECNKLGLEKKNILIILADVTKEKEVNVVVKKTVSKFGKLDALVNNAGIASVGDIQVMSMEEYDKVMDVNVRSTLLMTKEAVPYLIETKGSIVNISSGSALTPWPNALVYAMSKATLDHFTRCSAVDLAPKGVRVNSVNPGVVETPLYSVMGNEDEVNQFLTYQRSKHPMGRLGTVEDVANTVVFLSSDDASFTTGQVLAIDGSNPMALN